MRGRCMRCFRIDKHSEGIYITVAGLRHMLRSSAPINDACKDHEFLSEWLLHLPNVGFGHDIFHSVFVRLHAQQRTDNLRTFIQLQVTELWLSIIVL